MKDSFIVLFTLCIVHVFNVKSRVISQNTKIDMESRIIDGKPAVNGQFPHMVFLMPAGCGGSIIHEKWVLTAAHCAESTGVTVFMGDVQIKHMSTVIVPLKNIHIHPDWDTRNNIIDIALLEFEHPIKFTDNVKPIRIANSQNDTFVGDQAQLSGFGFINDKHGLPEGLQYTNLTVISNKECQAYYPFEIMETDLCTWGTNSPRQKSCFGDSGSGLTLSRPDGDVLIGITSFGLSRHCEDLYPSGFIRPNHFLDWIRETTGLDNI